MPSLNEYADKAYAHAVSKGFWENPTNLGERLMLIVSELAEALEEDRDGKPDVYVPVHRDDCPSWSDPNHRLATCDGLCKPEGVAVEIVDAVIRCLDTLKGLTPEVDIDQLMAWKMAHNATRPDKHGKAY